MSRFVLAIALLLVSNPALAQLKPPSDAELESQFRRDVAAASEDAAKAFDEANAARDAGRLDEAAAAYQRAIELAPTVDHPHRRLCSVLDRLSRPDEAVEQCEIALMRAPDSAYNKSGLANVLLTRNGDHDRDRALQLATEASGTLPQDASVTQVWCRALMSQRSWARKNYELRDCSERLLSLAPDDIVGNFLGAITAAEDQNFDLARRRLDKAKAGGLPVDVYKGLSDKLDEVEEQTATFPKPARKAFSIGVWVLGIWVTAMLVLLIAGFVLSRTMLRTVNRTAHRAADAEAAGTDGERGLRRIYKAVLLLSGVYFYLSMPVILGTIVAAGCGLILVFFAMGVIPIKLVVLIGIVVLATVGAILRSLFVRADSTPPGDPFDVSKHPKLRALLDDVASTVGTRPVDVAYLTPGTDMAVTERGGVWTSISGKRTERSLIMGVGLFDGMTQLQLRSILAHEHGHYRNEDTAGGGFALAVRRSLFTLIVRLAQSGVAAWWNPAWWFVRGFHRMYLGISQGASRLQEVLADRWAIKAYGSEAFIAGYKHVVARSVEFDHGVNSTIKEVIEKDRPLPNLYRYEPETKHFTEADLATEIETEMAREPTAYDSHPSPKQRLEWAKQLAVARAPQPDDDKPVWELFADREALERSMTSTVRERIYANHGIMIAEQPKASTEATS